MSGRMVPAEAVEGLIEAVRGAFRGGSGCGDSVLSLWRLLEPGLAAWEAAHLKGPAAEVVAAAEKGLTDAEVANSWSKLLLARAAAEQRATAMKAVKDGMEALGVALGWQHVDAAIGRAEAEWAEIVRQAKEAGR